MIGVLDPALLQLRSDALALDELNLVLKMCKEHTIQLIPFEEYWDPMWREFGRRLERGLRDPRAKQALREVRKLGGRCSTSGLPAAAPDSIAFRRGFHQLFGEDWLSAGWEERMARAVVRAVMADDDVVVLTRRIVNRNLTLHSANHSTLHINTRWILHVQPQGAGHRHIPCVYHPRNLVTRWTTRLDWRLPSEAARYPFCPPQDWWKSTTTTYATICSKPAWRDSASRGWARPNIPGGAGYHWDVYIVTPSEQQRIGVSQLNIVEHGAPATEGVAGDIHHIPIDKRHLVRDVGWSCP